MPSTCRAGSSSLDVQGGVVVLQCVQPGLEDVFGLLGASGVHCLQNHQVCPAAVAVITAFTRMSHRLSSSCFFCSFMAQMASTRAASSLWMALRCSISSLVSMGSWLK